MAKELKTAWICLATSGAVTHGKEDGRFIKKEWLQDMAETFNLSVYTPCIWPDHYRYYTFGKVVALKVEEVKEGPLKGELQLFGILCPNNALINANSEGQYCYPSIEVGENFHGTGKYFLKGLGVTDEPASAGVNELRFNKQAVTVISGHQFNVTECLDESPEDGGFKSLFNRIFSKFSPDPTETTVNPEEDDNEMKPEQFNELKTSIAAAIAEGITQLEGKFSAIQPAPAAPAAPVEPAKPTNEGADAPTAEQFKALQDELADLKSKFKVATEERVPGTPIPAPAGDEKKLIL